MEDTSISVTLMKIFQKERTDTLFLYFSTSIGLVLKLASEKDRKLIRIKYAKNTAIL